MRIAAGTKVSLPESWSIWRRSSRAPLIGTLSLAARRVLAAKAVVRRYAAGATLWSAGDEVRSMAIVLEGRVRVVREGRGRQHVLHSEGPGGTLGEVPLFAGGPAPATVLATAPDTLSPVDARDNRSGDCRRASRGGLLLGKLAERVRTLVERVDRLALDNATTRLAGWCGRGGAECERCGHARYDTSGARGGTRDGTRGYRSCAESTTGGRAGRVGGPWAAARHQPHWPSALGRIGP